MRLRTHQTYKSVIERHLIPALGHLRLQQVKPTDLKRYYNVSALSPTTLEQHHTLLHSALKAAQLQGLVQRNVTSLVIGKPHRQEGRDDVLRHCWEVEEAKYTHESVDEWWYTGGLRPLQVPPLIPVQRQELDPRSRTTNAPRLRTRAPMVLRSAEHGLKVPQLAVMVRESAATVLRWLTRSRAEGREGLQDAPRPGRPAEVTAVSRAELLAAVRRRPRSLGLPVSLWTLPRLVDYLAEHTGLRGSDETVRRTLKQAAIVLSRPQHKIRRPAPDYQVNKSRVKILATS